MLTLAALVLIAAAVVVPNLSILHVYERHFGRDLPEVRLQLSELSGAMDEDALRRQFTPTKLDCRPEQGPHDLGDRVCWLAVSKVDGVPALTIAFFLREGRLRHALMQVPWWAHGRMHDLLTRHWGPPVAQGGVAFWSLPGQHKVEIEQYRSFNPLRWTTVLWSAAEARR